METSGAHTAREFTARLTLHSTAAGGRSTAISSGYRPLCWFGGLDGDEKALNAVLIELGEGATELGGVLWLGPGESCLVTVKPLRPDLVEPYLEFGLLFEVFEGTELVGHGVVVRPWGP